MRDDARAGARAGTAKERYRGIGRAEVGGPEDPRGQPPGWGGLIGASIARGRVGGARRAIIAAAFGESGRRKFDLVISFTARADGRVVEPVAPGDARGRPRAAGYAGGAIGSGGVNFAGARGGRVRGGGCSRDDRLCRAAPTPTEVRWMQGLDAGYWLTRERLYFLFFGFCECVVCLLENCFWE